MAEEGKITVQAEDGKEYEFGQRMKVSKQSYIAEDGTVVTKFVFKNGAVREHRTPRDSGIYAKLAAHGADQKFGDEFAGMGDDVEDLVLAFEKMSERLEKGEWTTQRQSDGLAGTSMLARALVEISGESIDTVKARLSSIDAKQKAVLQKAPKVAEVIAKLKAERDAKKGPTSTADADKALSEFLSA